MDQLDYIRRQIPINSDRKLPPIFPTYTKKYKEVIDEDAVGAANLKAKQSGEVEALKAKHEKEVDALKLRHERENDSQKRGDEKEAANDQIQQQNKSEAEARRKEARAKASSTSESLEEAPLVIPTSAATDQMIADRLLAQLRKASFQKKVKIAKEFGIKLSKRGKSFQLEDFLGEFHSKMPEKIRVRILQHMNKLMDLPYGSPAFKKEKKEMEALQRKYAIKSGDEIEEGKKRFHQTDGIGKSKYTVSYHDGKNKHKDGSDFFDIKIFKNKPSLEKFKKDLKRKGYTERPFATEEVSESFSRSLVNKAIKLVKSPKFFQGDYTGAVKAIEKLKKGLSDDPRVSAALQTANEEWEKLEERNYKKEYANYHSDPKQIERRAARNAARKLFADIDSDKDVHHKDNNPLNNDKSNLSVVTQKYNRTEPRLREGIDSDAMIDLMQKYINSKNKGEKKKLLKQINKYQKKLGLKVTEELGANATQDDYIKDFLDSDAPQFKGKTKDKIIQMAVAAFKNK